MSSLFTLLLPVELVLGCSPAATPFKGHLPLSSSLHQLQPPLTSLQHVESNGLSSFTLCRSRLQELFLLSNSSLCYYHPHRCLRTPKSLSPPGYCGFIFIKVQFENIQCLDKICFQFFLEKKEWSLKCIIIYLRVFIAELKHHDQCNQKRAYFFLNLAGHTPPLGSQGRNSSCGREVK